MANNQEFYCEHCKKNTLFFLESDFLWYCDECENVLGSFPDTDEGDWEINDEDSFEFRCPVCNNASELYQLVDGCLCPVCFQDLSTELERNGYYYDDKLDIFIRKDEY